MDDTKDCSVNSRLQEDKRPNNEESRTNEEKHPSDVTLHKKEISESNENGHLLRRENQPEALESVHKYARRIKSFLGWEPLIDKGGEPVDEVVDGRVPELDCNTSDAKGEGNNLNEKKENENNIEIPPETEQDKSDKIGPDCKSEGDLIDSNPENEEGLTGCGELMNEVINKSKQDARKNPEDNLENDCKIINNPLETEDLIENAELTLEDISDQDTLGKYKSISEKDSKNNSDLMNTFPTCGDDLAKNSEELSKSDDNIQKVTSGDSRLGDNSDVPKVINSLDHLSTENNNSDRSVTSSENRDPDSENTISPETTLKEISESKMDENGNVKADNLETSADKLDSGESTTIDASEIKDITGNEHSDVPSEEISTLRSISHENESDQIQSPENMQEDLKSEDSVCLDENIILKNSNIKKPYMDEIRRLSIDIVKDVIESARNSIHEMIANRNEEQIGENSTEISNNSEISNQMDKNTEFHLNNDSKSAAEYLVDRDVIEDKKNELNLKYSIDPTSNGNNDPSESNDIENPKESPDRKDNLVDDDTVCGFGCFKPQWIQQYSKPKMYLILFSIIGVIHGCYYPYFVSIISTLEKRYAFKTKVSGTLLLADEITPLILGIIVGYIGSKTHRPRMVALGMFMSAACCFISGLPYLIYGPAKHLISVRYKNETGPESCGNAIRSSQCDSDEGPPTMTVVGIFLLASFLKGFATLSYYVIGISYMDDNIKKKNSPMYLAIALALRLLGPLVGFLMSSAFLKLYENPVDDPGFGTDDPRWVGAWWIGFFLQGVLLVIFTLPIALFPRRLPGQRKMEKNTASTNEDGLREILIGLTSALKRLGKNPVFIVMIINTTMKIFGHFGHSIMLPKYMENQFRLSASQASLYSGATSITCIMLATVFGGFLIWKFRPTLKMLLVGMIISEIILCIGFLILMFPRCQTADMQHFGMDDEGLILNSVCNQNCDCSTTSFTPFCGPDGKTTYFSPCYAGCTQKLTSPVSHKLHTEFGNCSCVDLDGDEQTGTTISEGLCPDEQCWTQTLAYLIILFILVSVSNIFTVAHTMILLRSVHPNDKSVALGTFETFICLFGFIPFPVTFGALVDSACLVWEKSCGETGNCWFYDMEKYAYLLHGAAALFCALSILCLITLYFLSSRVRNLYVDEEEETEYTDIKLDTVSGTVSKL